MIQNSFIKQKQNSRSNIPRQNKSQVFHKFSVVLIFAAFYEISVYLHVLKVKESHMAEFDDPFVFVAPQPMTLKNLLTI
jgi:hypothetical protein